MNRSILFALVALFTSVMAFPAGQEGRDTAAIGGRVTLEAGRFMEVVSQPVDGKVPWGGFDSWSFNFDGDKYVKEEFTLNLYEQKGSWDPKDTVSQQVVDNVKCVIETEPGVDLPKAAVRASAEAPYLHLQVGNPLKPVGEKDPLPKGFKKIACAGNERLNQ